MPRKSYWPVAAHIGCLGEKSASITRSAECGQPSKLSARCSHKPCGFRRSGAAGTTMLELVVVLAIVGVLAAIAMPTVQSSLKNAHLSAATTQVRGAILSTRFNAIMSGCPYTIAFYQSNQNYQVQGQTPQGAPPTCTASASVTIPWASSGDVSLNASTTMLFCPNGTVWPYSNSTACPGTSTVPSLVLSIGTHITNTLTVSGAGNVTVTSP